MRSKKEGHQASWTTSTQMPLGAWKGTSTAQALTGKFLSHIWMPLVKTTAFSKLKHYLLHLAYKISHIQLKKINRNDRGNKIIFFPL